MRTEPTLADAAGLGRRRRPGRAAAVYDRQSVRLFGVANAILRDRDAAADALQDAFLRVSERAGQFDASRGEASAWLAGIVRHAALDLARKRGRELPTDDPALGDIPVAPEALEAVAASAEGRRLRDCLAALDEKNRRGHPAGLRAWPVACPGGGAAGIAARHGEGLDPPRPAATAGVPGMIPTDPQEREALAGEYVLGTLDARLMDEVAAALPRQCRRCASWSRPGRRGWRR